jgi:hypothetical protein
MPVVCGQVGPGGAAVESLLLAAEGDEGDAVLELVGAQGAGGGQDGDRAGGVVVGAGSDHRVRPRSDRVVMTADDDPLRRVDRAQLHADHVVVPVIETVVGDVEVAVGEELVEQPGGGLRAVLVLAVAVAEVLEDLDLLLEPGDVDGLDHGLDVGVGRAQLARPGAFPGGVDEPQGLPEDALGVAHGRQQPVLVGGQAHDRVIRFAVQDDRVLGQGFDPVAGALGVAHQHVGRRVVRGDDQVGEVRSGATSQGVQARESVRRQEGQETAGDLGGQFDAGGGQVGPLLALGVDQDEGAVGAGSHRSGAQRKDQHQDEQAAHGSLLLVGSSPGKALPALGRPAVTFLDDSTDCALVPGAGQPARSARFQPCSLLTGRMAVICDARWQHALPSEREWNSSRDAS